MSKVSDAELAAIIHTVQIAVNVSNGVVFEALRQKGLLGYADIQEAIARIRDAQPTPMNPVVRETLNEMEACLQAGPRPYPPFDPRDPQR